MQVAPGHERSEVTLLGMDGEGEALVAQMAERLTGRGPIRRREDGTETGGAFDVAGEYEVHLASGLTRRASVTSRGETVVSSPRLQWPQLSESTTSIEYRLVETAG